MASYAEGIQSSLGVPAQAAIHGQEATYTPTGGASATWTVVVLKQGSNIDEDEYEQYRELMLKTMGAKTDDAGTAITLQRGDLLTLNGEKWKFEAIDKEDGAAYVAMWKRSSQEVAGKSDGRLHP